MVERRLPKPKVAGSNPVFRSKESPQNHRPQHTASGLFLFRHTHRSGKRGSPQDLLLPPVEGRGGYKKARNTRADFESQRTKNQCEFEPRFPLKRNFPDPKHSPPSKGVHFPRDITPPSEGEFPYHVHQSVRSGVSPPFCLSTPSEGEQKHKKIYSPSKGGTATMPTDSEYFVIVRRISYLCSTMAYSLEEAAGRLPEANDGR